MWKSFELDEGVCVVDESNIIPAVSNYVAHAAGYSNYVLERVEETNYDKYAEVSTFCDSNGRTLWRTRQSIIKKN